MRLEKNEVKYHSKCLTIQTPSCVKIIKAEERPTVCNPSWEMVTFRYECSFFKRTSSNVQESLKSILKNSSLSILNNNYIIAFEEYKIKENESLLYTVSLFQHLMTFLYSSPSTFGKIMVKQSFQHNRIHHIAYVHKQEVQSLLDLLCFKRKRLIYEWCTFSLKITPHSETRLESHL